MIARFSSASVLLLALFWQAPDPAVASNSIAAPRVVPTVEAASTDSISTLTWELLVPAMEPLKNPYDTLPPDELAGVLALNSLNSFPPGPQNSEFASEYATVQQEVADARKQLAGRGVDLYDVYKRYMDWVTEVDRRGKLTVKDLDGKNVAIAGYLLPLDFSEAGAKEFLLVPYVGACIHVPPPPPNQVIYVKVTNPYQVADVFDGVMVKGVMTVGRVSKDLSFMDGSSDVEAGYVLQAEIIEPYRYDESGQ